MDRLFWWFFKRATPIGGGGGWEVRSLGPLTLSAGFNYKTLQFTRAIRVGRHTLWLDIKEVPELEGVYDSYSAPY